MRRGVATIHIAVGVGLVLVTGLVVGLLLINPTGRSPEGPAPPELRTDEMQPRVGAAIETGRAAVTAAPYSAEAWGAYGEVLDAHELYEEAEQCYTRAIELDPRSFRWNYLLACVKEFLGRDTDEIKESLRAAAQQNDEYAAIYFRLGRLHVRNGHTRAAAQAYIETLRRDNNFTVAQRELGRMLLTLGQHEDARRNLEAVVEFAPNDHNTWSALAQVYMQLGETEKANDAAERVRRLTAHINSRDVDSLPVFDPIRLEVERQGVSAQLCDSRASILMAQGEFEEAIENLLIVLEVNPNDPSVHLRLGTAYMSLGDGSTAAHHLIRSIELDPESDAAYLMLGSLFAAADQFEAAVEHLRTAVELNPSNGLANMRLARALLGAGKTDEAIAQYRACAPFFEDAAEYYAEFGEVLERYGHTSEAAEQYERALAIDPDHEVKARLTALGGR